MLQINTTHTIILSENIFVAFEGRGNGNETSTFNMVINTCNVTNCEIGTNYNASLDNDDPYTIEEVYTTTISPTTSPITIPTEPTDNGLILNSYVILYYVLWIVQMVIY